MANKLFLVHIDLHGDPLPDAAAIVLHEGDNSLGANADNDIKPSSKDVAWGRKHAVIRVLGNQVEIEDLGSTGKTFCGEDLENITLVPKKSTRPLRIGDVVVLGKKDPHFDRLKLVSELPLSVFYEELNVIPTATIQLPSAEQLTPLDSRIIVNEPLKNDVLKESPALLGESSSTNMNISINYPTSNPNPVSIRIEGSPPKQVQPVKPEAMSAFDIDENSVKKSLTFADDNEKGGFTFGRAELSRFPSIEIPQKSALKTAIKAPAVALGPHFDSDGSTQEPSAVSRTLIADAFKEADNVVNRIVGPISKFSEFDAASVPDYVLMEVLAESVLSSKATSLSLLHASVLELKELLQQCRTGAAVDDSLVHNQVTTEFDSIFADLVTSMLNGAISCLDGLLRNNLFLCLKMADEENYDIGLFRIALVNRDRLSELRSYYQTNVTKFGRHGNQQLFEILARCLGPIVADLEKLKSSLDFINKLTVNNNATKKSLLRSSSLGTHLSELRSLKGKQKLLRRVLTSVDSAISRQCLKALNSWKQLVRTCRVKSNKMTATTRILSVLGRWRKRSLALAFSTWVLGSNARAITDEKNKHISQLQMDILVWQSKVHELASTSNVQAALAGERAINRELSQTNAELSQIVRELESKYLEFCQGASSVTKPLAQRKSDVRAVYMGQEEELAHARKCLKAMNEYLHEMQTQCESAGIEVAASDKWAQFGGGKKISVDSPPHKSLLRDIDYSPKSVAYGASIGNGPVTSRAAATAIILYEVRRLRQSMISAREECQSVKKQLAAEISKKIQLNLVIQDLDRRLTETHKGFGTLRQVLVDNIGEAGLLDVMKQVEERCPGFSAMLHPSTVSLTSAPPTGNSRPLGSNKFGVSDSMASGVRIPRSKPGAITNPARNPREKIIDDILFGGNSL